MTKITENDIELLTINRLERLGYEYIYAPTIAPDAETPERTNYQEVLLNDRLQNAVSRINPTVPIEAQEEALKEIQRIHSPELLTNNKSLFMIFFSVLFIEPFSNTVQVIQSTEKCISQIFSKAKDQYDKGEPIKICLVLEEAHTIVPEGNFLGINDWDSKAVVNKIGQVALQESTV